MKSPSSFIHDVILPSVMVDESAGILGGIELDRFCMIVVIPFAIVLLIFSQSAKTFSFKNNMVL